MPKPETSPKSELMMDVATPEPAPSAPGPIRVRIKPGELYYNGVLWRDGQVLEIATMAEFSRTMELAPPHARLSSPYSPKDALDRAVQTIRYGRLGLEPPERAPNRNPVEVI